MNRKQRRARRRVHNDAICHDYSYRSQASSSKVKFQVDNKQTDEKSFFTQAFLLSFWYRFSLHFKVEQHLKTMTLMGKKFSINSFKRYLLFKVLTRRKFIKETFSAVWWKMKFKSKCFFFLGKTQSSKLCHLFTSPVGKWKLFYDNFPALMQRKSEENRKSFVLTSVSCHVAFYLNYL